MLGELAFDVVVAALLVAPNAVARADAELLHVAARIVIVALDERAPGFLLRLLAGILQFAAPVGEPIANLWRIGPRKKKQ